MFLDVPFFTGFFSMNRHTWVQPWFRPIFTREKPERIRRRSKSLCRHLPVGPASTWLPHVVYRAWSFRIRPDLATKVIPPFPYLTDEGYKARRELLRVRLEVEF